MLFLTHFLFLTYFWPGLFKKIFCPIYVLLNTCYFSYFDTTRFIAEISSWILPGDIPRRCLLSFPNEWEVPLLWNWPEKPCGWWLYLRRGPCRRLLGSAVLPWPNSSKQLTLWPAPFSLRSLHVWLFMMLQVSQKCDEGGRNVAFGVMQSTYFESWLHTSGLWLDQVA